MVPTYRFVLASYLLYYLLLASDSGGSGKSDHPILLSSLPLTQIMLLPSLLLVREREFCQAGRGGGNSSKQQESEWDLFICVCVVSYLLLAHHADGAW